MKLTLPTLLTLFRIVLIPVFVILFYWSAPWAHGAAAVIYALASITDWFDGWLARVLDQESAFGAFLDPVADKLMVAVAIVLLVETHPSLLMTLPALIIISREITVSALREWMAELGNRTAVKVSFVGKAKTTAQMFSLFLMIWETPLWGLPIFEIGLVLFYLSAILTLYSMLVYLRAAWPVMMENG
jgi:CDP-diacylglycerol--glycerol-3-phosphate 3-phosphatidyltransferase